MYRYRLFGLMIAAAILATVSVGCSSSSKKSKKYILVVFSEDGSAVENAQVTPQVIGRNFESKYTGVDGQVNLRALYPEMPTRIMIRAPRHKSKTVDWKLPSPTAQTVKLEKF